MEQHKPVSQKKLIIFSVIVTISVLALAEITVRMWAYYFRTSYERYNYAKGRLELVPNIRVSNASGDRILINSKGFVGPEFEDRKREGVYRIFALGDSCTFGSGSKRAYPAVLQELLNTTGVPRKYEVINAGIEGYNSEYALARLRHEIVQYDPDMVVIYIGWNDLMKVNPNNLSATGKLTWLARLMERSYLMKAYSKLIFYYLRPILVQPKVVGDESDVNAFDQFVPSAFQDNLEMMVKILADREIAPVLVTLPTVVRPGMTHEELKQQQVVFPYYAGAYSIDKFLSLHRSYNASIRGTALKHGAPLVDLDGIFNKYSKTDLFWDTMHPSANGHRLIARALADKIQAVVE
jgi:lysophospholipase L1-like esterase